MSDIWQSDEERQLADEAWNRLMDWFGLDSRYVIYPAAMRKQAMRHNAVADRRAQERAAREALG